MDSSDPKRRDDIQALRELLKARKLFALQKWITHLQVTHIGRVVNEHDGSALTEGMAVILGNSRKIALFQWKKFYDAPHVAVLRTALEILVGIKSRE